MNMNIYVFIVFAVIIGIPAVNASTQLMDISDEIGDANHSAIDIVRVTISKDSDVYTAQIIVNGNIDTNNGQYDITLNDGSKDMYKIGAYYNINETGEIIKNTSIPSENSSWIYTEIKNIQTSVNGNTLNIVADFSGIDLTGYTFRKAGAYWYAPDKITLIEKDSVKFTTTPAPTPTLLLQQHLHQHQLLHQQLQQHQPQFQLLPQTTTPITTAPSQNPKPSQQ